jgi:hypothetical protein
LGNQFYYEEDFEDQYGDETETDCPFMTFLLKNYISSMRDMIRYIKDDSVKAVISYDNDAFVDTVE